MVLPASHGVSRVPWYSGAHLADSYFAYGAFTLFGCTFQCYSAIFVRSILWVRNPGCPKTSGLASSHFARRYFGNHFCFPFLRLLRCFSSPGSLRIPIQVAPIQYTVTEVPSAGFPHSDICGSLDICSSPQLFAAYHVFHRLLVPRHPPCALSSLT